MHNKKVLFVACFILFGLAGVFTLATSHGANVTISFPAAEGTVNGCASVIGDTSSSTQRAVKFGTCSTNSNSPLTAGVHLPITYDISSLTGQLLYVSPSGSDSNNGSLAAPYATLAKAITTASPGANIVLRGGVYRQANLSINKSVKIVAYPGEKPVFNGAQTVNGGWVASGSSSYHNYTPMPVTDGSGISYSTCGNQTSSCLGKYPDQAWVGTKQLRQVGTQAQVADGTFYVDQTNKRIYLDNTDIGKGSVEVSNLRKFATISGANVTLSGFEIIRYSNTATDYGIISLNGTADNSLLDNILMSDISFITLNYAPSGTDLNAHGTIRNSTLQYSNRMGISALATDYLTIDRSVLSNMNQFDEFTTSPQSGGLKTSRTWYTRVTNSKIVNNNSQGLWFDQSNYKTEIANNDIENNTGSGLFYEISDHGYIVNNYIKATGGARAVKLAASSNLYMVNNTVIGGADPVGVYVDSRSIPGCSTSTPVVCGPYGGSDVDAYHPSHPATMTWLPSINMFVNNIFASPTATGYCGSPTTLCITKTNGSASVPLTTVIHRADAANGIPQTLMDGNVYFNGTNNVITANGTGSYTSVAAFGAAMAQQPISIAGLETKGLSGSGWVDNTGNVLPKLSATHTSAYPVPNNTTINLYVQAGTKHYGVTWR